MRGGPARVIALTTGGDVLFDDIGGELSSGTGGPSRGARDAGQTERVVVTAVGALSNIGGSLDGSYAGESMPLIGWDMVIGAGVIVTFANDGAVNHERDDGQFANTRELSQASKVVTRSMHPFGDRRRGRRSSRPRLARRPRR